MLGVPVTIVRLTNRLGESNQLQLNEVERLIAQLKIASGGTRALIESGDESPQSKRWAVPTPISLALPVAIDSFTSGNGNEGPDFRGGESIGEEVNAAVGTSNVGTIRVV